ncbi:MAG: ABC transporter ATP-binding protein [Desulfobacteraceae bacterium]|nr:MAG: ABC transporter ATP-binding protein [Desulfobacteraceae bacterium]
MKSFNLIKPYFYQRRHLILCGVLCLMVVDTLQLLIPRVIKWAVDDLTALQFDGLRLAVYAGQILAIAGVMTVLRFVWRRLLIGTSRVVEKKLRDRLFFHIQTLSANYFNHTKTGDLMAHATNDINNIRMSVGMGMVALTDAVFLGSMAICFMAYINVRLTLFALIPMPFIVWMARSFGKKMHRRYTRVQGIFSDITESVRESFSGIRIVKAFNREQREADRVRDVSKKYVRENLKLVKITGAFFPFMVLFTNLSQAIVLFLGGRQAITMEISPGDFVAFISYLNLLTWPMMAMGWLTNLIQRGAASLDRINRILDTRPEILENPAPQSRNPEPGKIEFHRVSFTFPSLYYLADPSGLKSQPEPNKKPIVLTDISFTVPPGSVLGIVGPQGSGKTTLLQLIPRIYDISSGTITIDDIDIRQLALTGLRKNIGFVSQEPFLFSGTIRDNLTFGEPVAEEKLIKATRAAALYDTITRFPHGFDTIVGEKGVVLSGGQKQRMVLARALIQDPPFLLLDDPVGQVDAQTEAAIIDTIRSLAKVKTTLIVSHRISAVSFADRIIVLEDGHIVESGAHSELVAANNYYAASHAIQRVQERSVQE